MRDLPSSQVAADPTTSNQSRWRRDWPALATAVRIASSMLSLEDPVTSTDLYT